MKPNRFPFRTILIAVAFMAAGLIMGRKLDLKHEEAPDPQDNTPVLKSVSVATSAKQDRGEALTGNSTSEADDTDRQAVSRLQRFKKIVDGDEEAKCWKLGVIVEYASADEMAAFLEHITRSKEKEVKEHVTDLILSRWTELDAAFAMSYVEKADSAIREGLIAAAIGCWAKMDLPSVIGWLHQHPAGPLKNLAVSQIRESIGDIAKAQPREVLDFTLSLGLKSGEKRIAITQIARVIAADNLNHAIEMLNSLKEGEDKSDFFTAMSGHWARQDIKSALRWAESFESGEGRMKCFKALISEWSNINPSDAMAYVLSSPDLYKVSAIPAEVLSKSIVMGRPFVLEMLNKMSPVLGDKVLLHSINEVANVDPELAAMALKDVNMGLRKENRDTLIGDIARKWFRDDIAGALKWASSIRDSADRKAFFSEVGFILTREDPLAAANYVMATEEKPCRDLMTGIFLKQLAEDDPQAAVNWVAVNVDESRRAEHYGSIAQEMSARDPRGAVELLSNIDDLSERSEVMYDISKDWGLKAPDEAITWASSLESGKLRDNVLSGLSEAISRNDPEAAARLSLTIKGDQERDEAIERAICVWSARDPSRAGEFIGALEPGSTRDSALASFCNEVSSEQHQPELASKMVMEIQDEELRWSRIISVGTDWFRYDPPAARAWIQSTSLPEKLREELLNSSQ